MTASLTRADHAIGDSGHALTVFTVTGARPGPVFGTIGAVHGDEYEGPVVLSRLLAAIDPADMAGTWIVAPVANPSAVAGASRVSIADGLNLARRFPGDAAGTYTDQLAALMLEHVIKPASYLLDLHSGGNALASAYFAGFTDTPATGSAAKAMAAAFGAPFVWRHMPPYPPGRTMSAAADLGIPGIYVEATGGSFPPEQSLAAYERGVRGLLAHLGLLPGDQSAKQPAPPPRFVIGSGDLDTTGPSPATGICTAHVAPEQRVAAGDLLFTITDPGGAPLAQVRAEAGGIVMFARRNRWVEAGETLVALAVDDPQAG